MRYELENIEQQVRSMVRFKSSLEPSLDSDELDSLTEECERIKTEFKNMAASSESDTLLRRYFHVHQKSLNTILEILPVENEQVGMINAVSVLVTDLFESIRNEFSEYFDLTLQIPKSLRKDVTVEIEESVDTLIKILSDLKIDSALSKIIVNSAETFKSSQHITYVNLYFLRELTFRFLKIDTRETAGAESEVIRILISVNYNEVAFYNYYTSQILKEISGCESNSEKLDRLLFYFKIFAQAQGTSAHSFDSSAPPINIQLIEWISQEIDYFKQKFQYQMPNFKTETTNEDFKLNFDLSVSHLAYLFKSFTDSGIIQNKNTSELIRFLSKIVKTKKSETVSYDSFRAKFYNVESATKEHLKKTLQRVINIMDSNN